MLGKKPYRVNEKCEFIDLESYTCNLVEGGDMPMKHKECNCSDCLVGLHLRSNGNQKV